MAARLIYHDPHTTGEISPFDEVIVSIEQKGSVCLVCPYLNVTYLQRVTGLAASWKLLTDVEEWLGTVTRPQRPATFSFITNNQEMIRHFPGLHAKVIIGSGKALIGSANFTDAGITLRTEMAAAFEDEPQVEELQRWFDVLWAMSYQLPIEQIATYMDTLPDENRLSPHERPALFPHRLTAAASLVSLPTEPEITEITPEHVETSSVVQQNGDRAMESIEVDAEVLAFIRRFPQLSPNRVLRLALGIGERDPEHEHLAEQFREVVLRVLQTAGGRLELAELYRQVEATGMLGAGDYRGAETHWQNRIRYLADTLRREGVLRRDTERGIWELA